MIPIDILRNKIAKRQLDIRSFDYKEISVNLNEAKQTVEVKQGMDAENAKKVVKLIKDSGLKVQVQIMDNIVRVTGKKIDDLQEVIALCRNGNLGMPLQYVNMKS